MIRIVREQPAVRGTRPMAHEIAKLLLEHAESFLEREEAVRSALGLGMPLNEIESYLDWLDHVRPIDPKRKRPSGDSPRDRDPPG
jgi:hypothetical protein